MLNIQTDKILQQEMDRKVFLKTTGIALAGLIGISTVAKRLNIFGESLGGSALVPRTLGAAPAQNARSLAYGNASYGI